MRILKPKPPLPNPFEKDPFRRFPCGSIAGLTILSPVIVWKVIRVVRRR